MTNLLLSRFETYLLDEGLQTGGIYADFQTESSTESTVEQQNNLENRESYPAGFFSSL